MEKKRVHNSFIHGRKPPPKRQQSGSLHINLEPILNKQNGLDSKIKFDVKAKDEEGDNVSEETTLTVNLAVCKKEELLRYFKSELGDANPLFNLIILDDEKKLEYKCHAGLSQLELDIGLLLACYHDKVKAVVSFVQNGANHNFCDKLGRTALHFAALAQSEACMRVLINSGANIDAWDLEKTSTPLFCAAAAGSLSCVKLLVQSGVNVNARADAEGPNALFHAIVANSEDCVRYLIENGAEINPKLAYSETPLHVAASGGSVACMKILLEKGADIRAVKGTLKSTPLHLSVEDGAVGCATMLLERGANPDVRNSKQQTPLHIAALHQSYECIETLLAAGADPNARDTAKKTPLHNAIVKGSKSYDCVKLLLENGADPNVQDDFGYTPVHLAASNEYSSCVTLMMDYNVDLTLKTNGGFSVFNFIVRKTPDALSKLIELFDNSINYCYDLGDRDTEIRMDFRSLVHPTHKRESDLLECIVAEGQKDFLKHPLCESFLHLKWLKIRKYFLLHLFLFVVFISILTVYIMITFGNRCFVPELSHNCTDIDTKEKRLEYLDSAYLKVFRTLLIISVVNIILKEMIQISIEPGQYWTKLENWINWIITTLVCLLLHLFQTDGFIAPWQFHLAALSLIVAWAGLMLLIGRFPNLGMYVQMFTIVTFHVVKFLIAYCSLIIAFALSFSILFHSEINFGTFHHALLTTFVMMTGELEYNDKVFEDGQYKVAYPGTTELIFFAFLLLVSIVLMNLLVGLAVNDIRGLRKSARLERLVRLTILVTHVENIIHSGWLRFLPRSLLTFIHKEAQVVPSSYHWVLYLKPNDPRDKRLPKEIVAKASYIVKARRKQPPGKKLLNRHISDYSHKTVETYPDKFNDDDENSGIYSTINRLIADHDLLEDQLSTLDDKVELSERILSSMDEKMRILTNTAAEYSKQLKTFETQIMGLQGTIKNFVDTFANMQGPMKA